jgi:hypothetical protein
VQCSAVQCSAVQAPSVAYCTRTFSMTCVMIRSAISGASFSMTRNCALENSITSMSCAAMSEKCIGFLRKNCARDAEKEEEEKKKKDTHTHTHTAEMLDLVLLFYPRADRRCGKGVRVCVRGRVCVWVFVHSTRSRSSLGTSSQASCPSRRNASSAS